MPKQTRGNSVSGNISFQQRKTRSRVEVVEKLRYLNETIILNQLNRELTVTGVICRVEGRGGALTAGSTVLNKRTTSLMSKRKKKKTEINRKAFPKSYKN